MDNLCKYRFSRILRILLLIGILLALPISMPAAQEIGFRQGFQTMNGSFSTLIGLSWRKSPRVSAFMFAQQAPTSSTFGASGVIWFPITSKIATGLIVGPEVETIADDPTPEELITYLKAASGFAAKYTASKKLEIWLTANYYLIDHNSEKWRFSFTVSVYP